jgi:hypothetical protein
VSEVSTVLAEARGFKRHPLAPDPHPRSMQGMNTSYDCRKSSVTTGRKNGAGQICELNPSVEDSNLAGDIELHGRV